MNLRLLNRLYTALILFLTLFLVYAFASQARIQTDLTALLPSEQQPDALLTAADKAAETQLNSQVILLAGSTDAETAFQTASQIADAWRKSGVFEQVDSSMTPNLDKVRADMQKRAWQFCRKTKSACCLSSRKPIFKRAQKPRPIRLPPPPLCL